MQKHPAKSVKWLCLGVLLYPKCCNRVAMSEVAKGRKLEVFEIDLLNCSVTGDFGKNVIKT